VKFLQPVSELRPCEGITPPATVAGVAWDASEMLPVSVVLGARERTPWYVEPPHE